MPTPPHRRAIPDTVEIPALPAAMDDWFALVRRADGQETHWQGRPIDLAEVIDAHSAARALDGFRYERTGTAWKDLAGEEPGDWRREWVVLAFDNGAPFLADLSLPGIPVLTAPLGGPWQPEQVHDTLAEFIAGIDIIEPSAAPDPVPPLPALHDVSLTVLDWGPERAQLIAHLVRLHSHLYQPPKFRRKVETPVVLTRRLVDDNARAVLSIIEQHGGRAEIGAVVPKQPRASGPTAAR